MPLSQAEGFFPNRQDLPKVGLYFDIDCWLRPMKPMTAEEITKLIRQFSADSNQRHSNVVDLILRETPHGAQRPWVGKPGAEVSERPNA
jgi:hypothetical protein